MAIAVILHDVVHSILPDDDPALSVPKKQWVPVPEALVSLPDTLARHIRQSAPYGPAGAEDGGINWASVLAAVKEASSRRFAPAFAELDAKRTRPAAEVAEAMALGETPKTADLDILGQLNMVAEENRELLAQLDALVIPEGAGDGADEAAVLTVLDTAENIRPWLPWATGATGIGTMREGAVGANVTRPEAVGVETMGPEAVGVETMGAETFTQGKVTS